jgi:hypothetical protein
MDDEEKKLLQSMGWTSGHNGVKVKRSSHELDFTRLNTHYASQNDILKDTKLAIEERTVT